jgi:hypothetical protein
MYGKVRPKSDTEATAILTRVPKKLRVCTISLESCAVFEFPVAVKIYSIQPAFTRVLSDCNFHTAELHPNTHLYLLSPVTSDCNMGTKGRHMVYGPDLRTACIIHTCNMRSKVLTAVNANIIVIWDLMPCNQTNACIFGI